MRVDCRGVVTPSYSRESRRVKTLRQAATTSSCSSLSLALLTSCGLVSKVYVFQPRCQDIPLR